MIRLERTGFAFWRKTRLIADERIDVAGFDEVARRLGTTPRRARKSGLVCAREAIATEPVETRWNGQETVNTAQPGDFVVTLLTSVGDVIRDGDGNANTYVVARERFGQLYEPSPHAAVLGEAVYAPKGVVDALELPGGFDIVAPWGEQQTARDGYLLRNGADIYGNNRETFEATYMFID